ncbi:gamma-glutamyl-gamma-aminobutyrate hydrolase family protein [Paenibacillus sp. JCM 10914]|uniref:gamma-glutamyl-gamma-aminobutyrate hydrolase family protein n=1 Tax=Paenibacillus sp. JCM 10914 TaxID=1236974 RepID=UPI0003CC6F1C|nr:gamma-glutamyl-gamma-aminobutyrate hydrolase family protein [Paenibacillus sp. JCM 10914]GAE09199.1 glutamine amidotransferase, class I [Paenibacillus sp. JCM 10914]
MQRPLIGVLPLYDSEKESYWMLPGYMKAVEHAGGIPVMLPLTTNAEMIKELAQRFDGFLFTGGHDVNPVMYGEAVGEWCGELCHERDRMESMLFAKVLELDKPALGICRGLQLFNILLGGSLYQDIPAQLQSDAMINHKQKPPYSTPAHRVQIEAGSLLHHVLQTDAIEVNSYHHQGIKVLSGQLSVAATAADGMIESVFMPIHTFVLGVQWHPEFSYQTEPYSDKIFFGFVNSCRLGTHRVIDAV